MRETEYLSIAAQTLGRVRIISDFSSPASEAESVISWSHNLLLDDPGMHLKNCIFFQMLVLFNCPLLFETILCFLCQDEFLNILAQVDWRQWAHRFGAHSSVSYCRPCSWQTDGKYLEVSSLDPLSMKTEVLGRSRSMSQRRTPYKRIRRLPRFWDLMEIFVINILELSEYWDYIVWFFLTVCLFGYS